MSTAVTQTVVERGVFRAEWASLTDGEAGLPASPSPRYATATRTIQVTGNFGTGGTVLVEGSNDGSNWSTLHDNNGGDLSFTTGGGIEAIAENPLHIRARVSAGTGVNVKAVLLTASAAV